MLLDRLVRSLAANTLAHRGHEHLGGRQERQVTLEFAINDRREGAEIIEHGEEGLEESVEGEERIR